MVTQSSDVKADERLLVMKDGTCKGASCNFVSGSKVFIVIRSGS